MSRQQQFEKVGPPRSESPFHHVNAQGLALRLQVQVLVRDDEDRIALAHSQTHQPGRWWIPAETLQPNEDVEAAASRVSETWFGEDLEPELADVITFPADTEAGERAWYILHVFEAEATEDELNRLPDGVTVEFVEPGAEPPGPWAMDHGSVWPHHAE
jgi:ADP-ribose pyrophosphatase YjhB (NUDIX family)